MSSPREAIYDVLLSKADRETAASRAAAAADWEEYEAKNRVAHSDYRGRHGSHRQGPELRSNGDAK